MKLKKNTNKDPKSSNAYKKESMSDVKLNWSAVRRFLSSLKFKETPKQETYEVVRKETAIDYKEPTVVKATATQESSTSAGKGPGYYYRKWLDVVNAGKYYKDNFEGPC